MAPIPPRHTFLQEERLKRRSVIDSLFRQKQVVSYGGIRLYWITLDNPPAENISVQYGFAVSKMNFPRAVDRNRIKRLMREAVRLQKAEWAFSQPVAFMWVYSGKKVPDFEEVFLLVKKTREKWLENIPQ